MRGMFVKCVRGLVDVHFQNVVDILVLEADLQRFAIEPAPFAHRTGDPDVGQEVHLQAIGAVAFAGLATAPGLLKLNRPGR